MLLPLLDPAGSKERSSRRLKRSLYRRKVSMIVSKPVDIQWYINSHTSFKGPNFLWHVDGNDKLNPMELPFMDALMCRLI